MYEWQTTYRRGSSICDYSLTLALLLPKFWVEKVVRVVESADYN